MKSSFFSLIFFLFLGFAATADTFVVTSNLDAGAGTLREALTLAAANGTIQKDFINFNLKGNSENERTIILKQELPFVTSNIVIDASTQPGSFLGISPAKICIKADRSVYQTTEYYTGCLNLRNVENVEIYSLYIREFYSLINQYGGFGLTQSSAIYLQFAKNIIVGAPGKGNVFDLDYICINASTSDQYQIVNSKIKIQSNWFGLHTDGNQGVSVGIYMRPNSLGNLSADDSEFGGIDESFGNILGGYTSYGLAFSGKSNNVRFNKFGFEANSFSNSSIIPLYLSIDGGEFSDNKSTRFRIELNFKSKNFKILRNEELFDPSKAYYGGIEMAYSENIQIGSDDFQDVNIFLQNTNTIKNFGSKNIEIRKNVIYCSEYAYSIRDQKSISIQVLVNNDSEYSGIATPNSEVYIYNDNTGCTSCSPVSFYSKINADASGKWAITGNFKSTRFVANATLINTSSEFTQPHIRTTNGSWYSSINPACGLSNGSLEMLMPEHILSVEWYNSKDEKVGEGLRVENLPAGTYYALGFNGKCFTKASSAVLINNEPTFITNNLKVQQPSCGKNNGSITGIIYYSGGSANGVWYDENKKEVAKTNFLDLNNLYPGSYTLTVTTLNGCSKSYGPIILKSTEGPNIERSNQKIQAAKCNSSDGSIRGISATGLGLLDFLWKDKNGLILSKSADLTDVRSGEYTLEVRDESTCGLLTASFFIPESNSISIDITRLNIGNATCNLSNGSITGINVSANDELKWFNEKGDVVGFEIDLKNVRSGKYRLQISNSHCSKTTEFYTIQENTSNENYLVIREIEDAFCNGKNGKITIRFNGPTPKSLRWADESNNFISNQTSLSNLSKGSYKLYITNDKNCETLYDVFMVNEIEQLKINQDALVLANDKCGLQKGFINGLIVQGGIPPYRYEWRNIKNELVGNQLALANVSVNKYVLTVYDSKNCTVLSDIFSINFESSKLIPPSDIAPIQICASGNASFSLPEIKHGDYLLYDQRNSSFPIAKSRNSFSVNVMQSQNYFVSYSEGACESEKTVISIVVAESAIGIPNSFSPNNDNINDTWSIKGLNSYPEFMIRLFNRNGMLIFSSSDPNFSFDGKTKGIELPIGIYYYTLKLRTGCSILSGSLTLLR
jgi:gliding motility-associated-like protein